MVMSSCRGDKIYFKGEVQMLYLFGISQAITSFVIFFLINRSAFYQRSRKRAFVSGTLYSICYTLVGMTLKLWVPQIFHAAILFVLSIPILYIMLHQNLARLIIKWTLAYTIYILAYIAGQVTSGSISLLLFQTEDQTFSFGIYLPIILLFSMLLCKSKVIKKIFDKVGKEFSGLSVLSLWIGLIIIVVITADVSYTQNSHVIAIRVLENFLLFCIIVAMSIMWSVSEYRLHKEKRAAEKQIHEYKHIVRSAVPPHQMQDLRVYEAQLADVEDLAPTGSELCDGCIHNAARQCHAEGIGFDLTVNALLTSCVKSNKIGYVQLEMILDNLLQNAIDASHPGGQIEVILMEDHSGIYQIVVCDDGDPIDPYVLKHWGTDGITTKENGNGFGIGEIITSLSASAASFYVYQPRPGGELKCLTIRFDGKGEMAIKDKRDETRRDEPVQDSQNG